MPRLPVLVDGDCDSRFNAVKQVFRDNFVYGWESEGAAFAVYLRGEKVIDLWGGYADASSRRRWKDDTMTLIFSCTKSVCAICFALLVDRGLVAYEDLVTKYWPEFGQSGKETITIDQLLSHQAGLAFVDGVIEEADVKDWTRMSKLFEKQAPNWAPGDCVGYHAITIGWLYDQLVRRIDPKKRSLSTFFKEEIAIPYGIDLVIGAPLEMEHRIARLAASPKLTIAREIVEYPIILRLVWNMISAQASRKSLLGKVSQNVPWMANDFLIFNNPDYRGLDVPSATGMSTARALAKLHSLVADGNFLHASTVEKITKPVVIDQMDLVLTIPESKGRGFIFTKNLKDQWLIGHPGVGGQNAKVDVTNKVAFAYVCNGLKSGMSDYVVTFMRLQKALYNCLDENSLLTDDLSAKPSAPDLAANIPTDKMSALNLPTGTATDKSQVEEIPSTNMTSDKAPATEQLIVDAVNDKSTSNTIQPERPKSKPQQTDLTK
uniref:Beta-lactamase domain-containing protein n=2 Tax=Ascaris TaxID=6251 RepID=A0A0M3IJH3_ASCLU